MPSGDIWAQFPLIAVIVLVMGVLGYGLRKAWLEFTGWLDRQEVKRDAERKEQDIKREEEREKQRIWQERLLEKQEQVNEKRELRWQEIYREMMLEVTNELKCLRTDLGNHHEVAVQIKAQLDQQATRPVGRKRAE